ncbi:hypothetical protein KBTX_02443 [wastewater metagenome]|uniref:Uncharacterized protein n=2 Tax=unclassified sequences TaxID=12908 RepID=A0A5B8RF20_9ZZZZ|nr:MULTISPECIES: hypothetical protein [Arhodomonas]MCS4505464.1 hypothetical protein [Arhodomonas aquaeolei]QEA06114.1 hypothetical protein KBTEX_02443 [uncultured organism]
MQQQPQHRPPAPASGYYFAEAQPEQDRAVSYSLTAAHGWEFLIDNHVREQDTGAEVMHAAVLGEN